MRMKIVQIGNPVLRQEARTLTKEEIRSRETQDLIEALRETMYDAPGVGLAAPQVGLPLQLAVIEDKPEYFKDAPPAFLKERERTPVPFQVIVNPRLTLGGEERVSFYEGCLSLAGFTGVVPRARTIRVECLDHRGEPSIIEASGWYARILQHEVDHLQGTVYIDRMHPRTFSTIDHFNAFWKDKSMAEVKRLLDWKR
jgi:peptide deformylase